MGRTLELGLRIKESGNGWRWGKGVCIVGWRAGEVVVMVAVMIVITL